MALSKQKKKEITEEVESILREAESVVFANFHGLSVADTSAMRAALYEQGIRYRVAKKTLVKRALDNASYKGERPSLEGELALVAGSDPIAPARELQHFAKQHKDALSIIGGIFEGVYMDKEAMTEIAMIPPRHILYGQFVHLINSPIQGLVMVLDQIAQVKEA
jgi:large subunit ribosomal protein L10